MVALVLNATLTQGPPDSWNRLTLCSIHKKGDKTVPGNYRGIVIMSFLPKLMATITNRRLAALAATQKLQAPT